MRHGSPQRAPIARKPVGWWECDGARRWQQDQMALAGRYPGIRLRAGTSDVVGEGTLTLVADCGIPTRILVRLEFPPGYPHSEPRVYDGGDRFPHEPDRHFYPSGRCCLWLQPESRWRGIDPEALPTFMDEVAVFFERQLAYDALPKGPDGRPPKWPWPDRSHGILGYVEWIMEELNCDMGGLVRLTPEIAELSTIGGNAPCPCNGGAKYKLCHRPGVERVRRKAGRVELCRLFRCLFDVLEVQTSSVTGQVPVTRIGNTPLSR